MSEFITIPEKCKDYPGYKKGALNTEITYKCGKAVWEKEENIKKNVKCYDDAHTKQFCITEARIMEVHDQVWDALGPEIKYCQERRERITQCLGSGHSIFDCQPELDSFKECVDSIIKDGFHDFCRREKLRTE